MSFAKEPPPLLANRSMPSSGVIPVLGYADVVEAVQWLCTAFGFAARLEIGDHRAQLEAGEGHVVVASAGAGAAMQSVMVRVPDAAALFERAVAHGARIINAPADQPYGERQCTLEDLGGHRWTFSQSIADVDPASWGGQLAPQPAGHLVLLGDSIFDNAAYTEGEPDVVSHLRRHLPAGWRASLCAVDGATTAEVAAQLAGLPADASHLVLSVGGNDALSHIDLIEAPVASSDEALRMFHQAVAAFEQRYVAVLDACLEKALPLVVCTVYNGCFPIAAYQQCVTTALALFNDTIIRAASARRLDVIDLRLICTQEADYANPIEPSGQGGAKIAEAIADVVMRGAPGRARARVFGA